MDQGPEQLRGQVRAFLRAELAAGSFRPHCNSWMNRPCPAFSRKLAQRGWLGLTLPPEYGGAGATAMHRLALSEELLAVGSPVAAHWVADRQMGPNLVTFGSDELKHRLLPGIVRGELFFCIGMSEPDTGSDLASVRTRAHRVAGGWRLSGTKVWTSGAHFAHHMMTLARSSPATEDRHAGLSQFVVDLSSPGVRISPIVSMDGAHHFNEVVLDDVLVDDSCLVGTEGQGWRQVTAELAHERSGPERYMSTVPLLSAWAARIDAGPAAQEDLGRLLARLWSLRRMSADIAEALQHGESPQVEAAMVKDLGAEFERDVIQVVRRHHRADDEVAELLRQAVLDAPTFTLRGGTPEILRGLVARHLGIR